MARDEIEEAYREWCGAAKVSPYSARAAGFRAGYVAALRRAEKIARNAGREGTLLRTPNSIEVHTADRIAAAISSLAADPPRTEKEGG